MKPKKKVVFKFSKKQMTELQQVKKQALEASLVDHYRKVADEEYPTDHRDEQIKQLQARLAAKDAWIKDREEVVQRELVEPMKVLQKRISILEQDVSHRSQVTELLQHQNAALCAHVEGMREVVPYIPCTCRTVPEYKPQETTIPIPPVKVKCFACEARDILSSTPDDSLRKLLEPLH